MIIMEQILMFSFVVIMLCTTIIFIYGVWLATLLTIELVKEWLKDGTITSPFLNKQFKRKTKGGIKNV